MTDQEILKLIQSKERALKENLLTTLEAQALLKTVMGALDQALPTDSIVGLRYQKLKNASSRRLETWWSTGNYPTDNPWSGKFEQLLQLLEQHLAEKTIKRRLETEGLFVESRSQGEDEHLLIGKRDGGGEKAHITIDAKTGEIRIEDNQKDPTELVARVETILTLPNGKKIKTSREALEELVDETESSNSCVTIELDKEPVFNAIVTTREGLAESFSLTVAVIIKNSSVQKVTLRNIQAALALPEGYESSVFHADSKSTEDINGRDFIGHSFLFRATILGRWNGGVSEQNAVWVENKDKALASLSSTKISVSFSGECVSFNGTKPLSIVFDITSVVLPKLKK